MENDLKTGILFKIGLYVIKETRTLTHSFTGCDANSIEEWIPSYEVVNLKEKEDIITYLIHHNYLKKANVTNVTKDGTYITTAGQVHHKETGWFADNFKPTGYKKGHVTYNWYGITLKHQLYVLTDCEMV